MGKVLRAELRMGGNKCPKDDSPHQDRKPSNRAVARRATETIKGYMGASGEGPPEGCPGVLGRARKTAA